AFDQRGIHRFAPVDIGATSYHVWHNLKHELDVSGDDSYSSIDALDVINYLNTSADKRTTPNGPFGPPYYDVTNDGTISPIDALSVINYLNAKGPGPAGEPADATAADTSDLLMLLTLDVASQPRRRT